MCYSTTLNQEKLTKRLRSYLSTYHATHPEEGCVLPTLGPEIVRASPQVRALAESERTCQEILASRRRFPDKAHQDGRG
jgi:TetR/AcrR family transcriptional regulator, transcriptional repressor for nem operon